VTLSVPADATITITDNDRKSVPRRGGGGGGGTSLLWLMLLAVISRYQFLAGRSHQNLT
jgi:hypothetical protein